MISTYLTYIFGTISSLIGFYLFLVSFKIYTPKHKTENSKIRFDESQRKFGSFLKVASIVLILNGAYDLIIHDTERYLIGSAKVTNEWTSNDRDQLINECIIGAGKTGEKYPELVKEYCECSTNKIMDAFTKAQYINDTKKTEEERMKILKPVFQSCIDEFEISIDSINK
jgi:hypothetical protein